MGICLDNKIIEYIKKIAQRYPIEKVILFGSRARGDNKDTSDIDLAVYPFEEFNNKGSFVSEIDDLETLLKIDLVFIDRYTDKKLIENIENEGVVIYERL